MISDIWIMIQLWYMIHDLVIILESWMIWFDLWGNDNGRYRRYRRYRYQWYMTNDINQWYQSHQWVTWVFFWYRRILHTAHTADSCSWCHVNHVPNWRVKTLETNLGGGLPWSVIQWGGDTRPNLIWRSIFRCFNFISQFRWFLFFWDFNLQSTYMIYDTMDHNMNHNS